MKVILQDRKEENVRIFFEQTQDAEIQSLFPFTVNELEKALQLFHDSQKPEASSFGQIIMAEDQYIGDVWVYCVDEEDEKMAMLSIVIFDKDYWKKGIGTEALKAFIPTVFEKYKIDSIGAFTYAHNIGSQKALIKAGFAEEERFVEDGIESVFLSFKRS